jgi:protein-L-isoaspartate(D-aspartate) O-methyltransferase
LPTFVPHSRDVGRMQFVLDLRRRGIMDAAVLRAMEEVPRENFVMPDHVGTAYADRAMPLMCGQTISQPYVVAYMTQELHVARTHRALEVGTGSGYQTAVLSRLAASVTSIERYRTLADAACIRLKALGYDNIQVVTGDGIAGVPERAPFDRIMVTAAAEEIPEALLGQLAEGGMMIVPLGPQNGAQTLVRLTRTNEGIARTDLIAVRFVPLLPGQAREL